MRQRHLETFFAVMTYGTVTQAAMRLGVTQPSVTLTLRQAEKELGFTLFDRAGGRLVPTTEARGLYEEVARAHASLVAIKNLCTQLKKGDVTQLRIVAVQTLTEAVIPHTVEKFVVDQIGYDIEASTLSSNNILEAMDTRRDTHDIGFIFGDSGDCGVYAVAIGESPIYCVAPAKWKITRKKGALGIDLTAMKDRPLIALNETEPVGRAGHSMLLDAGINPDIHIRAQNHRLAGELAARGLGYALLDALSATAVAEGAAGEVHILPVKNAQMIPVTAILARANNLTRTARRFIELFTVEFQNALRAAERDHLKN